MPKYRESQFEKRSGKDDGVVKAAWWTEPKDRVHKAVSALLETLRQDQQTRDADNHLYLRMFMGRSGGGIKGDAYARAGKNTGALNINVARTTASAANAKVAKNKVRVLHLTEGGNWGQQARAKRLTKLINGIFYASSVYREMARAQLDACIWDLGAVYFWREGTKVKCERVPGCELRFDAYDARYGRPSQLIRDMVVPRAKLLAEYAGDKAVCKIIKEAPRAESDAHRPGQWVADCVEVRHAWHLKSGEGADDGYEAVTLQNGTLYCEPYKHDYFPFVFHIWEENPLGFGGQSVCSQLVGIQASVTKVARDIQDHSDLSTGFVAMESGSQVSKAAFTNDVWRLIEFTGTPPQMIAPPAFQQEKLAWLQFLLSRAPQDVGMSEMSVTSRKPAGLDSGKALREFNDLESERFQMVQQRWEESFVHASNIICDLLEEAHEEDGDFEIKVGASKLIESISWAAARIDRENYTTRPVPTSFLPSTPSAKLQTIQEMMQAGMLGREEGLLLLDYPDLERVNNQRIAPLLNIEWRIERMLDPDKPKYEPPESFMNLPLALKLARDAYNQAQQDGVPELNLQMLRDFASDCERIMAEQAAKNAAPPPAAPGAPAPMPDPSMMPAPDMGAIPMPPMQ